MLQSFNLFFIIKLRDRLVVSFELTGLLGENAVRSRRYGVVEELDQASVNAGLE